MSDRLERLETLRDQLTERLGSGCADRDFAALSARLVDVLAQIEALVAGLPDAKKGTALDEFSQRLADRQAEGSAGAKVRKQPR